MQLGARFDRLTLWNKINAIGSFASIASIPLSILVAIYFAPPSPEGFELTRDSTTQLQAEVTTESGLKYRDLPRETPKPGQLVTVLCSGRLTNGRKLGSLLKGKPFTFRAGVGEVVKGFDEGVMKMKVGDKREFTIPPHLFYGPKGVRDIIPDNATAIYEVELLSIN